MTPEERMATIKKFVEEHCYPLLITKGEDYTRGESASKPDALANFKTIAAELQLSPLKVWYIYFRKHLSAIKAFIVGGKVESEPIEGRIADAVNYLLILHCLLVEKDQQDTKAPT